MGNRVAKPSKGRLEEVLVTSQEGHGGNRGLSHHAVLYSLPECSRAFRPPLSCGLATACLASNNGFLAPLPQPALERVPSATNANCAVADDDRIGSCGHNSRARGAFRFNAGLL